MKTKLIICQLIGCSLYLYLHHSAAVTCVVSSNGTEPTIQTGCKNCVTTRTPVVGPSQKLISRDCWKATGPTSDSCNTNLGCVENCFTECCNKIDTPCTPVDPITGVSTDSTTTTAKITNPSTSLRVDPPKQPPQQPVVGPENSGSQKLEAQCQSQVALVAGTLVMILLANFV